MCPKWSHYLDDDFEDDFKRIERIPQKPKRIEEGRKKPEPEPPLNQKKQK